MRILIAVRLLSGLRSSIASGRWQPNGAPAIFKFIEQAVAAGHDLRIVMLDRAAQPVEAGTKYLDGLAAPVEIRSFLSLPDFVPRRIVTVLGELHLAWKLRQAAATHRADVIYTDRSLYWQAGLLARFGRWPVVWRVLGISPNLQEAWDNPA
ncbi:MAG: glycosyltransferase, partial [Ferrovibrio sp.]